MLILFVINVERAFEILEYTIIVHSSPNFLVAAINNLYIYKVRELEYSQTKYSSRHFIIKTTPEGATTTNQVKLISSREYS